MPARQMHFAAVLLLLATVCLTSFSLLPQNQAIAAQTATTTANLRLRQEPSSSSDTILVMPTGSRVEITGAAIGTWYPVIYQDTAGYASGAYLRLDPPTVSAGQMVRTTSALNLRAGPATTFAVLTVIPNDGEGVLTGETDGPFYELTYNSQMGWAHSDYLQLIDTPGSSPTPTTVPTNTATPQPSATAGGPSPSPTLTVQASATATADANTATVNARLNLRTGAGTNFPVVTIMPAGATVELLGDSDSGFERVRYGQYEGWAYASYLDIEGGADNSAQTTARVNMRSGASTSSGVVRVLGPGTSVTITGTIQNGYLPVIHQGTAGWIFASYLSGSMVPPPAGPTQLNVLLYHRIRSAPGDYQVTASQLRSQMAWLRSNGYESVLPRDLLAYINNGTPLPPKPVMITIDDSNDSDRLFKQILDEYGFEGVWFFVSTQHLTNAEMREYNTNGEVCGHTANHLNLPSLSYAGQWAEVYNNKVWLESRLGVSITCFGYPYGAYTTATTSIVRDAGYQLAFDAWGGSQHLIGSIDLWHIVRWNMYGHYTLTTIANFMS